jgi:hypothetical protein
LVTLEPTSSTRPENSCPRIRGREIPILSEIIKTYNERFGVDFPLSDADIKIFEQWCENLKNDPSLQHVAQENEFEDFLLLYERKLQEQMVSSISQNQYLVSKIFSDKELKKKITINAASFYHNWAKTNDLPAITPETPSQNRSVLRQAIHNCKGFIHWIDLFFNKEGLEFLMDSFDTQSVKEIKLLTSLYNNNENQIN